MARILIKFPTRSRPDKFRKVLRKHMDYLSGKNDVKFIVTMDEDDVTMNTQKIRTWLDSINVSYNYGKSKSKIEACNADMEKEKGDIVILTSDDMIPCVKGYDEIISVSFKQVFPDYIGAIKFNDGLRKDNLMTLPVLGFPLFRAIGHFYHPDYESLYADNELTMVCSAIGKLATCNMCIIRHEWVSGSHPDADEMHKRQESPNIYKKDNIVYQRRMKNNFDVDQVKARLDAQKSFTT